MRIPLPDNGHRKTKLQRLALVGVVLLFPIFFFYHTAIAFGVIPPFLRGWFGPVAAAMALPLLWLQIISWRRGKTPFLPIDFIVCAMVVYMALWASIHLELGQGDQKSFSYYLDCLSALLFWIVLHIVFRNVPVDSKFLRMWLLASIVAMFVIAVTNSERGFFYAARYASSDVEVATYQGFARSALVVLLLSMGMVTGWANSAIYVSGLSLLFLLGARSEFVGFAVAGAAAIYAREGGVKTMVAWLPLLVGVIALLAIELRVFSTGSRILQLMEITQSGSYQARMDDLDYALSTIRDHPLLGGYASQFGAGGRGAYAHNAISAWVGYGLIGFLFFAGAVVYCFFKSSTIVFRSKREVAPQAIIAFAFAIYGVIEASLAKSVYDPIFATAWGSLALALSTSASNKAEPILGQHGER